MTRIWALLILAFLAATGCQKHPESSSDFAAERKKMVEDQLKSRGIKDERVLAAMAKVPREEFVPQDLRSKSYSDSALSIGEDRSIPEPFIVAFTIEQFRVQPADRILKVGSGSGYQIAVLAELAKDVYSVENVEKLGKEASARLTRLGYSNAHVKVADGNQGWPEVAPFDAIIVTCAPDKVPQPLAQQLKENGRMIIPVGAGMNQQLFVLEKKNNQLAQTAILPVRFFLTAHGTVDKK